MDCPKDGSLMVERDADGVILDFCLKCGGMWMDWGELRRLAGIKASEEELTHRGSTDLPCPRCGKKMDLADLHGVTVETCKHGIFFDSGEAEKIVGRELKPGRPVAQSKVELTAEELARLISKGSITVGSIEVVLKR